jgi:hypothetical protein
MVCNVVDAVGSVASIDMVASSARSGGAAVDGRGTDAKATKKAAKYAAQEKTADGGRTIGYGPEK